MRNAFAAKITELAAADDRIVLLTGDIGNRLFDNFRSRWPKRFYNCGIAEANMVSLAAGLALCGLRPVVYTIASFATTRCLEQIRLDICYHELPVIIVGTGAGLSYASLGATHHACEDIALLRVLPGMTVVCPGDSWEVSEAIGALLSANQPGYLRLGKKGEPQVHANRPPFRIGQAIQIRSGTDMALLGVGNALALSCTVADLLSQQGYSVGVYSLHTIKPLDEACLREVFSHCGLVATIEEHSRLGGAGGTVAEWLAQRRTARARFVTIGTPDVFFHAAGSQEHVRHAWELTPQSIAKQLVAAFHAGNSAAIHPTGSTT